MTPWLVRLNAKADHPHELVGLFVAGSIGELVDLVDECCPAGECEAIELPPGGIYQDGRAVTVPANPDAEPPVCLFHGATVSDGWVRSFYHDGANWVALR